MAHLLSQIETNLMVGVSKFIKTGKIEESTYFPPDAAYHTLSDCSPGCLCTSSLNLNQVDFLLVTLSTFHYISDAPLYLGNPCLLCIRHCSYSSECEFLRLFFHLVFLHSLESCFPEVPSLAAQAWLSGPKASLSLPKGNCQWHLG